MGVQISPSILSADFTDLASEVGRIAPAADWVHVDVMDNHFVPNLTLGLPVVERLAAVSTLPLDVHLMIEDADRWAPEYASAGGAVGDLPRRGGAGAGAAGPDPAVGGRAGRDGAAAGDRGRALRRAAAGDRHAAADDGGARLRRSEVPRPGAAQGARGARADQGPRPRPVAAGRRRRFGGNHRTLRRGRCGRVRRRLRGVRRRRPGCRRSQSLRTQAERASPSPGGPPATDPRPERLAVGSPATARTHARRVAAVRRRAPARRRRSPWLPAASIRCSREVPAAAAGTSRGATTSACVGLAVMRRRDRDSRGPCSDCRRGASLPDRPRNSRPNRPFRPPIRKGRTAAGLTMVTPVTSVTAAPADAARWPVDEP